eukprot:6260246-Pyramimonas_sp.AAC.1
MRCSQHRLRIVFEVLQDEKMRAPKGAQDGSYSALESAENDELSSISAMFLGFFWFAPSLLGPILPCFFALGVYSTVLLFFFLPCSFALGASS